MLRIGILAAVFVAATQSMADDATARAPSSEPARDSARETTLSHKAETPPVLDLKAAHRALRVTLGALTAEEKASTAEMADSRPNQIGIHRPLPSGFTGDLAPKLGWVSDPGGQSVAAMEVGSEGAVSVRIAVHAMLPAEASVQVFDGDGTPVGPAYTQEHFGPHEGNSVWLPSAEGERLIVQITAPSEAARTAVSFIVTKVAHRYAHLIPKNVPLCSGHVDLPCVTDRVVRDIADAVARLAYEKEGVTGLCTGTLLNVADTPEVFEPYLLTAHHCISTELVARSVEAAWFWQRAACRSSEVDERLEFSFRGTELLATSLEQDSTLLRFRETLPRDLSYAGWDAGVVRTSASVFSVHHPNGFTAQYASGLVANAEFSVFLEYIPLTRGVDVRWLRGLQEGGSSGSGLFANQYLIGVLSGGPRGCNNASWFGSFRDFFPHVQAWLDPRNAPPRHVLPAVPGASAAAQQGFIRVMNRSPRAGTVSIYAIDDTGKRFGPATLHLDAFQSKQFNSIGLERGNASIGLIGGVGDGTGMWRVELKTTLNTRAFSYIRTPDGFLTSMHQLAQEHPQLEGVLSVPFFNPASNTSIRSLLRVINPHTSTVNVSIVGLDSAGRLSSGEVSFSLTAGAAILLSAQDLENGASTLTGRLGDGKGKWELSLASSAPVQAISLLSTRSGHLSNVSF